VQPDTSPPTERAARLREVHAAVAASDTERAVRLARQALSEGLEEPLLLNLRAYWYEQQGRANDALNDLKRARLLAPDDAFISNAFGLCLARLNRSGEARRAFQDAVKQQSEFAPAHFNLGWISEDLGLLEDARQAFLRAEQLDAGSADPPARLAYLAARTAEGERARRHAARALGLEAQHPLAHLALALCEFEDRHLERAEAHLRQVVVEGRTGSRERAMAHGLLGDCLDAQDKPGEAFAAYTTCNREFARLYAPQFRSTQLESVPAYLSRIIGYFSAADASAWKSKSRTLPETSPVAGHVFILGFPCSGTTLLEDVLVAHPHVCATGERDGLGGAVRQFLGDPEGMNRLSGLDWSDLRIFREMYWRELRESGLAFDGKVLVDNQPYNAAKLPLLTKLFPDAKILFMSRDPRDIVLSCFRSRFRMSPTNYELLTLEGAARLYDGAMRLFEILRAKLPLTMVEIPYETLVRDFHNCVVALFRYVGLNPKDAAWDAMERARTRAIATPGAIQIARGLSSAGIGSWRRYADRLAPILPLLQPWIDRFGAAVNQGSKGHI
jgi:tetratricopeptide (TPR) repeat protein